MVQRECQCDCAVLYINSPLNHEDPARQQLPAKAQHLADLPLETSLVLLQMHWVSPYTDYLCGSSNPVSKKGKEKNNKRKIGTVAMSVSLHSNANQGKCPAQLYI